MQSFHIESNSNYESPIRAKVFEIVEDFVSEFGFVEPPELKSDTDFFLDLDFDSLDVIELVLKMELEFDIQIPDKEMLAVHTIQDLVSTVMRHRLSKPLK